MFRRAVVTTILALVAVQQATAAWYIWYRKCPSDWKRYGRGFSRSYHAKRFAQYHKRHFPNYVISRNWRTKPGSNPCGRRSSGGNRGITQTTQRRWGLYIANCRVANPQWRVVTFNETGAKVPPYVTTNKATAQRWADKFTRDERGAEHYGVGVINAVFENGRFVSAKPLTTPSAFGIRPCNGKKASPGGSPGTGTGGGSPGGNPGSPGPNPPRPRAEWVIVARNEKRYSLGKGLDAHQAYCQGMRDAERNPHLGFDRVEKSDGSEPQGLPKPFTAWVVKYFKPGKGWVYYTGQLVNGQTIAVCSEARKNQWIREVMNVNRQHGMPAWAFRVQSVRIYRAKDLDRFECKNGYVISGRKLCGF